MVGGVFDNDTLYPLVLDRSGVVLIDLLAPHTCQFGFGGQSAHSAWRNIGHSPKAKIPQKARHRTEAPEIAVRPDRVWANPYARRWGVRGSTHRPLF
jgi:hypothetical protein